MVYLAANSGARVGLANEVKQCLQARMGQIKGFAEGLWAHRHVW